MTSRPSTAAPILAVLAVMLVMLTLYFLSVGPGIWLVANGFLEWETFDAIYWPIAEAADRTNTIPWLGWYTQFWADL